MTRFKFIPLIWFGLMMASPSFAKMTKIQFQTSDGLQLHARIYEPLGSKRVPGILLIEGSGRSHFEEELESSPFFQLAQDLSAEGFVVLTYSKRGSGPNQKIGSWANSSFKIDNQDAQSAFLYLKTFPRVNEEKMFLFGQSLGCLHSSLLAQKNRVRGVVLFAGGYQNFYHILEEQNLEILKLSGKKPEQAKKIVAPMMNAFKDLKEGHFKVENHRELVSNEDGATIIDGIQEQYLKELFQFEPLEEVSKVQSPVLIVQGSSDFIISPKEYERAKKALGSKPTFSFRLLDGVDHVMSDQLDAQASLKAMMTIKETKVFAPLSSKLSKTVVAWLRDQK